MNSSPDRLQLWLVLRPPWVRYGLALLLLAGATGLRYLGLPPVTNDTPFITYTPAILLAYLFLGAGAGRLLLFGGALGGYWLFSHPYGAWVAKADHLLSTLVVVGCGLLLDWVLHQLRRTTTELGATLAQLRHSERRLAQTAAEFHELYETAPCAYFSMDSAGRIVRLNGRALAWFGVSRQEVLQQLGVVEFFQPASRELFAECLPLLQIHGHVDGLEFDLVGRQGETRRVTLAATVLPDETGATHTHCVLHDITEVTRAKRRLQSLAAEQRAILDNEVIGILKLDGSRTVWKNRAFERMFGYRVGELRGPSVRRLYRSEAEWADLGRAVKAQMALEQRFRTQVQMVRKDGSLVWVDLSAVRVAPDSTETLWTFVDVTSMMERQLQSDWLAYRDALTGLPNRHRFDETVPGLLARSREDGTAFALCFLDLDGFKPVNDIHGHAAGDLLLREVAARITGQLRADDRVYRFGGDEFVILLPTVGDRETCTPVMERVREAVAIPVRLADGQQVCVTASVGVALFPADACAVDELVQRADHAMYLAKQAGPGRLHYCEREMLRGERPALTLVSAR